MTLLNYLPLSEFLTILGALILAIFVWAAFSPFESLGWWAGWFGDKIYDDLNPPTAETLTASRHAKSFLIFLSGVGRVSGEPISYREKDFLKRLQEAMPETVIVDDIFPYSVNNLPLTAQPYLGWFWRWTLHRKLSGTMLVGYLINIRNIFQIFVSVDRRYAPVINQGLAEVMMAGLLRHGYDPASNTPIYIIGYSGSGQMAVGPAKYVKEWVKSPLYVISLGGVFASDPSLLVIDHLYHLVGDNDKVERYRMIEPGNWPLYATSDLNRALRQGKITRISMGPMHHTGRGGYLDAKSAMPDGKLFIDKTVQMISDIIRQNVSGQTSGLTATANAE